MNSPHKGPVTRKMFLFYDVIMSWNYLLRLQGICKESKNMGDIRLSEKTTTEESVECLCCRGLGSYQNVSFDCGDTTVNFEVKQMSSCGCWQCGSDSGSGKSLGGCYSATKPNKKHRSHLMEHYTAWYLYSLSRRTSYCEIS